MNTSAPRFGIVVPPTENAIKHIVNGEQVGWMIPTVNGKVWVPDLNPKQFEIWNCYKRYQLINGPRMSGKSIVAMHRLLRHAWDTSNGRIIIFSKNLGSALRGGIWSDLIDMALPQWIKSGIGMRMVDPTPNGPKQDQARCMHLFVSNAHGNKTEILLNSLDFDGDVEKKLKERRFSMIYFSELSKFNDYRILDTSATQLRMTHLKFEQHLFLADTNPHDDGPEHWIYKRFYVPLMTDEFPPEITTDAQKELYLKFKSNISIHELMIEDNPRLSQESYNELQMLYLGHPGRAARYLQGKWVGDSTEGFFSDVYNEQIHVVPAPGSLTMPVFDDSDPEVLLPAEGCRELVIGLDPGDRNFAIQIAAIRQVLWGKEFRNHYDVIDELVATDTNIDLDDLIITLMEMMDEWEEHLGYVPNWRAWSDKSALRHRAAANTTEAQAIFNISNGRVRIMQVPGPRPSQRLDLMRRLVRENRLLISARCVATRQMFRSLKPQQSRIGSIRPVKLIPDCPAKHPFDSLANIITMEEPMQLAVAMEPNVGRVHAELISM